MEPLLYRMSTSNLWLPESGPMQAERKAWRALLLLSRIRFSRLPEASQALFWPPSRFRLLRIIKIAH